jgi:hypothetical protein
MSSLCRRVRWPATPCKRPRAPVRQHDHRTTAIVVQRRGDDEPAGPALGYQGLDLHVEREVVDVPFRWTRVEAHHCLVAALGAWGRIGEVLQHEERTTIVAAGPNLLGRDPPLEDPVLDGVAVHGAHPRTGPHRPGGNGETDDGGQGGNEDAMPHASTVRRSAVNCPSKVKDLSRLGKSLSRMRRCRRGRA